MNNTVKIIAIVAGTMIALGLILAGIGYLAGGNQGIHIGSNGITVGNQEGKSFSGKTETFSEELGSFKNIDVDLSVYDVDLIPSDKYFLECNFNTELGKPSFTVENDTLIIKDSNHDGFKINLDIFNFNFNGIDKNLAVKIYYPKGTEFNNVKISCDASDLSFDNIKAGEAYFDLDFGKLELSNITAKNVEVKMDSGDLKMSKINVDDMDVSNSFGKTTLEEAELKDLKIKANSGGVSVTNVVTEKSDFDLDFGKLDAENFVTKGLEVESNSGQVDLQGTFLGNTEIVCNMGEVTIDTDVAKDQYSYELHADSGSIYVGGDKMSSVTNTNSDAPNFIKVDANMGDINVNFK